MRTNLNTNLTTFENKTIILSEPRRMFSMTKIISKNISAKDIKCERVLHLFETLRQHGLYRHDAFHGNFKLTNTAECPISVIDLEEKTWRKFRNDIWISYGTYQPWIANKTNKDTRHWRNPNCISMQSMFPCLKQICNRR